MRTIDPAPLRTSTAVVSLYADLASSDVLFSGKEAAKASGLKPGYAAFFFSIAAILSFSSFASFESGAPFIRFCAISAIAFILSG